MALFAVVAAAVSCAQTKPAPEAAKPEKAEEHEVELDIREVAPEQRISIADAIVAARKAHPGRALEAGMEGEVESGKRSVFVEVMILDESGEAYEVKVDAADGKILSSEKEDEAEEVGELTTVANQLPAGHVSLGDLARHTAVDDGGKIVSAGFGISKTHGPVCAIVYVVGREARQILLDPKTGAVLAKRVLEMEEEEDEEGEEHEGAGK
jgi:uncharacterized membrane protein YkoI